MTVLDNALRFVARLPWYVWAGLAGGGAILLFGGPAGAATPGDGVVPPGGKPPVLKLGATGPWVRVLRDKLDLPLEGAFDASVDKAVRAYQKTHGLTADGVVGPITWKTLGVSTTAPPGGNGSTPPPDIGATDHPFGLSDSISERETQILQLIKDGDVDHQWYPLTWSQDGHEVSIHVSRRALALLGDDDRLTVNTSYRTAQKIADLLGGAMLTTRMSDEIAKQASLKLAPTTQPWSQDGTMAKTARMVEQSDRIDDEVGANPGLIANEGKDWVLTRRDWLPSEGGTGVEKPEGATGSRHNATNFGWYPGGSTSPGGASVIQSVGKAHDKNHTDYSQLLRFVAPGSLRIDGEQVDLAEALADPELSPLLQDEGGILPGIRHPDL